jgi:hypothetical protein
VRGGLLTGARQLAHRDAAAFGEGSDRTSHLRWRIAHGTLGGRSWRLVVLCVGASRLATAFSARGHGRGARGARLAVLDGGQVLLADDGTLARELLHDGVRLDPRGYERRLRVLAPVDRTLAPPTAPGGALRRLERTLRFA